MERFEFELQNFHLKDIVEIVKIFKTSLATGVEKEEAVARLSKNGPNIIPTAKQLPLWAKFFLSFTTGFAPLLWGASALAFISWEPFGTPPTNLYNLVLAIVLIIVIFLSSMFSFYQELQATLIIKGFSNLLPSVCLVTRSGTIMEVMVGSTLLLTTTKTSLTSSFCHVCRHLSWSLVT